jgi:hypothetical protein
MQRLPGFPNEPMPDGSVNHVTVIVENANFGDNSGEVDALFAER